MNKGLLHDGERLDDLEYKGLHLIQNINGYCFTSDAVILSNCVIAKPCDTIVDFGCGNAAITILVKAKTNCKKMIGIEFQNNVANLAKRNVEINNLENIEIINDDVNNVLNYIEKESIDVVVCNPPYFKSNHGITKDEEEIALSRHESSCDLNGFISNANKILKFGGKMYLIHKTERLSEVLTSLSNAKLEPKNLLLVYPKANKKPDTFIVCAKKGGSFGLDVDSLVVYEENGDMTIKAKEMYNKL